MGLIWCIVGAIVGAVLGATVADDSTAILGLFVGAAFGLLLSRVLALDLRTRKIEGQLAALQARRAAAFEQPSPATRSATHALDLRDAQEPNQPAASSTGGFQIPVDAPPPVPPANVSPVVHDLEGPGSASGHRSTPVFPAQAAKSEPDIAERAIGWIKSWFTEGNVPVKIGMLVLFAGVAALLKYAADEGWFTLPIELRLAGIAAAALAALVFAWRQRDTRRAFSLSLQGGAIGILLLTVFAAFRLYQLLPAEAAFALMLVLVAGVCVLAVLQDALALAVLGILAGFAAPILISTGSGNHVVLFSYYAVLNLAIFAIAWQRAWRVLNLLGFFFTYAIGTLWGVLKYNPTLFDSTEPFLILFFSIYLAIPVLYAIRLRKERPDVVDGTLVFGNPLVAFALQAALLDGERTPLAISALALGLVYLVLAAWMIRRIGLRILGESFAVLALGFSTLAVPLALSARTTGCVFALEGAALVWLGLRQQRRLPRWIGLFLQLLAAFAFVIAYSPSAADALPVANGAFLGAILISAAALVCAWLYQRAHASYGLSLALYLWGLFWWLGAWMVEIGRYAQYDHYLPAVLGLLVATAWLAAEAQRIWQRGALAFTTAVFFWLVLPVSLLITVDDALFSTLSLFAHMAFAVLGWRSLVCLRNARSSAQTTTHLGWFWAWTLVLALCLREVATEIGLGSGWVTAMLGLPLLLAHTLVLRKSQWISPPLSAGFSRYRPIVLGSQAIILSMLLVMSLFHPGDSSPIGFIPLLNPLELFQLASIAALAFWMRDRDVPEAIGSHRAAWLSVAGFALITAATLRAVHHLGGIPWSERVITSSLSQTSLAVVWSVLGVAGWVLGSRRGNRPLWLAGAVLMAIVLVKLLLIDRQHLGNLFGIASFIAYGLLCTLVGYLAPAPPRKADVESAA
ncbi:DUF2339 domain-containing protein [Dokdonella sp.]|uniref:DUF2339 domain-containing protein n=1 Tax=Dokdonella sp. TaxID=2291710 RepID=UPI0035295FF2